MNLSTYVTSVARTLVPSLWGAAISWAVYAGLLPPALQDQAQAFASVLVGLIIALYYALVRLLEAQAWWPAWLSAVLLGAPVVPSYGPQDITSTAVIEDHATGEDPLSSSDRY